MRAEMAGVEPAYLDAKHRHRWRKRRDRLMARGFEGEALDRELRRLQKSPPKVGAPFGSANARGPRKPKPRDLDDLEPSQNAASGQQSAANPGEMPISHEILPTRQSVLADLDALIGGGS